MASAGNASGSARDGRLAEEALGGILPRHMRELYPRSLSGTVDGRSVDITICGALDDLAIGSDDDHLRVPLGLPAALRVAEVFDMMLPTTTAVYAIFAQADVRIAPSPMTPGAAVSPTQDFLWHSETLNSQVPDARAHHGLLLAGHKKDVILANRLSRNPGCVAIYGWHRRNGRARRRSSRAMAPMRSMRCFSTPTGHLPRRPFGSRRRKANVTAAGDVRAHPGSI